MRRSEFFERVPELFRRANLKSWESYEETLYAMRRPLTYGNYSQVKRFVGIESPPVQALRDGRVFQDLDRILNKVRYPRAGRVTQLDDYADGSTELASALLHFNNPAFPIYDATTVRGLAALGAPVRFVPHIEEATPAAYQEYIDEIQELKDRIPYRDVPEKNYYLTRIVQLALWGLGLDTVPAVRAAPSRSASRRPAKKRVA